jgi:hypothetical protein
MRFSKRQEEIWIEMAGWAEEWLKGEGSGSNRR